MLWGLIGILFRRPVPFSDCCISFFSFAKGLFSLSLYSVFCVIDSFVSLEGILLFSFSPFFLFPPFWGILFSLLFVDVFEGGAI